MESYASVGGTLGVGGHTTFAISVWVGEKQWHVQQRYSIFHALKTSLDDEVKGGSFLAELAQPDVPLVLS